MSWWRGTSCAASSGARCAKRAMRCAMGLRTSRRVHRDVTRTTIVPCASNYPRHEVRSPCARRRCSASRSPAASWCSRASGARPRTRSSSWSRACSSSRSATRPASRVAARSRLRTSRTSSRSPLARCAGSRSTRRTRRPRYSLAPRARSRRAGDSSLLPRRSFPTRWRSSPATTSIGWPQPPRPRTSPLRCRSACVAERQALPRDSSAVYAASINARYLRSTVRRFTLSVGVSSPLSIVKSCSSSTTFFGFS